MTLSSLQLLSALCATALATMFALAGARKVAAPRSLSAVASGLGVHGAWWTAATALLGVAELSVAALFLGPRPRWGAVGAFALLIVFAGASAWAMSRNVNVPCNCFGARNSSTLGRGTLLRVGALGIVCAAVWAVPTAVPDAIVALRTLFSRSAAHSAAGLLLLVSLGEAVLLLAVLRRHGELLRDHSSEESADTPSDEGGPSPETHVHPLGERAPALMLRGSSGGDVSLENLARRHDGVLLVWTDRRCAACERLAPELVAWSALDAPRIVVIALGTRGTRAGIARVPLNEHEFALATSTTAEARAAFGVRATPMAQWILRDGTLGSPRAEGAHRIRALVRAAHAGRRSAPLAEDAPSLLAAR